MGFYRARPYLLHVLLNVLWRPLRHNLQQVQGSCPHGDVWGCLRTAHHHQHIQTLQAGRAAAFGLLLQHCAQGTQRQLQGIATECSPAGAGASRGAGGRCQLQGVAADSNPCRDKAWAKGIEMSWSLALLPGCVHKSSTAGKKGPARGEHQVGEVVAALPNTLPDRCCC